MARLAHPNVVAVFDAETHDGVVVIVMEYVAGPTLREWLEAPRSWREIVAAFVAAGRGLLAAHRVGIVHGDFKPSNVLIGGGPLDDEIFKVGDFGLARPFDDDEHHTRQPSPTGPIAVLPSSDDPAATTEGLAGGTPKYMAPEQHIGAEATAASDQFAFCVSLWEALVGKAPFDASDMSELAVVKLTTQPEWPRIPGVPRPIATAMRVGLRPKPAERWRDLGELLGELERASRPRAVRLGAPALALALVGSVGALTWWRTSAAPTCDDGATRLAEVWNPEREAEIAGAMTASNLSFAGTSWARAHELLDGYGQRWVQGFDEACRATHVRGEESTGVMALRMNCLERARSQLRATVDMLADPDRRIVENAIGTVKALPSLDRCSGDAGRLTAEILIPDDPEVAARVEALRVVVDTARATARAGHDEDALANLDEIATDVEDTGFAPLIAEHGNIAGRAANELGRYDDADRFYTRALDVSLAGSHHRLAAEAAVNKASLHGLQQVRSREGRIYVDFAIGLSKAAGNIDLEIDARYLRAAIASYDGHLDEAERECRAVIEVAENTPEYDDIRLLWDHPLLARLLYVRGAYVESEAEMRFFEQESIRIYGEDHPNTAFGWTGLSAALYEQGRMAEAEDYARKAIATYEAAYGPHFDGLIQARDNLASTLQGAGRSAEAEVEYRAALALAVEVHGEEHATVATIHRDIAEAVASQGRDREAEAEYRASLAMFERLVEPDHPQTITTRCDLGSFLRARGRAREALPLLEACWKARQAGDTPPPQTGIAAYELARALHDDGDATRVAELLERARASCAEERGRFAARCREAIEWRP